VLCESELGEEEPSMSEAPKLVVMPAASGMYAGTVDLAQTGLDDEREPDSTRAQLEPRPSFRA